jgi:hypothetical protein
MTMTDANDFLMGGGVSSAKFPTVGTTVTGVICRPPEVQQQTDITTGAPKFWDDGKPRQQLQVQLQTEERDPEVDNDDGIRAVYVKAQMQKAVREAVKRSGAKGLEIGGTLTVTYIGDGVPTQRGMSAPKQYSAVYVPASAAAANEFLAQGEQPAWSQPAPQPAPVPAQEPPAGVSAETLAAFAQLTPQQKALLNLPG